MESNLFLILCISLLSLGFASLFKATKPETIAAENIESRLRRLLMRGQNFRRSALTFAASVGVLAFNATSAFAQEHRAGGEANLQLPDLSQAAFFGVNGRLLLMIGLVVCVLGMMFGLAIYMQLKNMPVHRSMREISELIYETCKT